MELYINNSWTESYESGYLAEAIAWSENGNHATIYATGSTADEANTRLMNALRELKVLTKASVKGNECSLTDPESPVNACEVRTPYHLVVQIPHIERRLLF
jgi:hypothetical protein